MSSRARPSRTARRWTATVLVVAHLAVLAAPASALPAERRDGYLAELDLHRRQAGVGPVPFDRRLQRGVQEHADYLRGGWGDTGSPHVQRFARRDHTTAGAAAARGSVIAITSTPPRRAHPRTHLRSLWSSPFHALYLLSPRLQGTAIGESDLPGGRGAVVVSVTQRVSATGPRQPVAWPGDGATIVPRPYDGTERPDPLTACPWRGGSGTPILLQLPAGRAIPDRGQLQVRSGGRWRPVPTCLVTPTSYVNRDADQQRLGRQVLSATRAVVLLPRDRLADGRHEVTLSVSSRGERYRWGFTADARASGRDQRRRGGTPSFERGGLVAARLDETS